MEKGGLSPTCWVYVNTPINTLH